MFVFNAGNLATYQFPYLLTSGKVRFWGAQGETSLTLEEFIEGHLTFTTRESYLSWVASWKEQYKALTVKCHAYRKLPDWIEDNGAAYTKWLSTFPSGDRGTLRNQARLMLLIRAVGKVRSWEMKQRNLQAA